MTQTECTAAYVILAKRRAKPPIIISVGGWCDGWQTQLQVCQPHHSLQNNIIICLPFDMNFNFTLLSSVAKGAKWNFSFVPITLLPGVTFWRVEGHNGLWEGISGRITTNFFCWEGIITLMGEKVRFSYVQKMAPLVSTIYLFASPLWQWFSLGSLGYFRK